MAKKSVIQRNLKRIQIVDRYKDKRAKLKAIITDKDIPVNQRFAAQLKLSKLLRDSSSIRIRNRCCVTGRGRGVYRKFGLSRIILRELCSFGYVPGMLKSSW